MQALNTSFKKTKETKQIHNAEIWTIWATAQQT